MILKCTCKSNYQDNLYGKGYRVFTSTKDGYRCSICKREIKAGSIKEEKKEGK